MTKATFELNDQWRIVRTSMLPDTIAEALEQSINKWEYIEGLLLKDDGVVPSCGGGRSCALCATTYGCDECPVCIAGHLGCEGTPYRQYKNARGREEALTACRAEIEFLKSLREED